MLNRLNDYSRLSFRMFFKNKLISSIVLVILLVVSIFTITVMNILFSYIELGKDNITETYNKSEKAITFRLSEGSFTDENLEVLFAKAKEWGYDSKLDSTTSGKIDGEYYHLSFCNEYFNDYAVSEGKNIKDNCQNTDYVWLNEEFKGEYAVGDKILINIYDEKEFEIAGFCKEEEVIVNVSYMDKMGFSVYDDMDSYKDYSQIKKIYDEVTSKALKKQLGLVELAKNCGIELNNYAYFNMLVGDIISSYLSTKLGVLAVVVLITVILLGVSAGVIKNYFNICKEKNFNTLKMYSALGIKDRDLGYMFVMPLVVLSIAIGIVALGISVLICLIVQPVVLQFVFKDIFVISSSLYMISPAPFFVNIIVILLFVTISFVTNFKTLLSKKKSFLSEVK